MFLELGRKSRIQLFSPSVSLVGWIMKQSWQKQALDPSLLTPNQGQDAVLNGNSFVVVDSFLPVSSVRWYLIFRLTDALFWSVRLQLLCMPRVKWARFRKFSVPMWWVIELWSHMFWTQDSGFTAYMSFRKIGQLLFRWGVFIIPILGRKLRKCFTWYWH